MKKICLLTMHTPTPTNYMGASALPFHLSLYRPIDFELEIWSFNLNGCPKNKIQETEKLLNCRVHLISIPKSFNFFKNKFIRLFLSRPLYSYLSIPRNVIMEIKEFLNHKDVGLWIYGEDIANLSNKMPGIKTVVTTPDCEAMYYYRVMGMREISSNKFLLLKNALMYYKYSCFSKSLPNDNLIKYHLVGEEDTEFLKALNSKATINFIRHPHYDVAHDSNNQVAGKIKLLVAGRYDHYMKVAVDEAIDALIEYSQFLNSKYVITFLGKNWDSVAEKLKEVGYDIIVKNYVENYIKEITGYNIQLTPIVVGTGTKGKVLDALANGLLVIGNKFALENIAVENKISCIEYKDKIELIQNLIWLADNPSKISEIADKGKNSVLKVHGREIVAKQFFSLF